MAGSVHKDGVVINISVKTREVLARGGDIQTIWTSRVSSRAAVTVVFIALYCVANPANTGRLTNAVLMLAHRLRR